MRTVLCKNMIILYTHTAVGIIPFNSDNNIVDNIICITAAIVLGKVALLKCTRFTGNVVKLMSQINTITNA